MIAPGHHPFMRPVDPDAEMTRLAEDRKAASRQWLFLSGEIFGGPDGAAFQVQVSATKPVRFPPDLLARLAAVVRECWPEGDGS